MIPPADTGTERTPKEHRSARGASGSHEPSMTTAPITGRNRASTTDQPRQLHRGSDHGLGWHAGDLHSQTRPRGRHTPILTVALRDWPARADLIWPPRSPRPSRRCPVCHNCLRACRACLAALSRVGHALWVNATVPQCLRFARTSWRTISFRGSLAELDTSKSVILIRRSVSPTRSGRVRAGLMGGGV